MMSRKPRTFLKSCLLGLCSLTLLACADSASVSGAEWSAGQMAERTRRAIAQPNRLERVGQLAQVLEQLSPENLAAVLAVYDEYWVGLYPAEQQLLMDAWARFDAESAFAHAWAVPYPGRRPEALDAAMLSWSRLDPVGARSKLLEIAESRPRLAETLQVSLVRGWGQSVDSGLLDYLLDYLLEVSGEDYLASVMVNEKGRRVGLAELLLWAEEVLDRDSSPSFKSTVFEAASRIVALQDIEVGREFIMTRASEDFAPSGVAFFGASWAETEPEAALSWLASLESLSGASALGDAFRVWVQNDPVNAMAWLNARPSEAVYESAYPVMARRRAQINPSEAMTWCERIEQSKEARERCLAGVALVWVVRKPDEALEWLRQSPLDESLRKKIIRRAGATQGSKGATEDADLESEAPVREF